MIELQEVPLIETARLRLTIPEPDAAPRMLSFVEENRAHFAPWSAPEPQDYYTESYWRQRIASARSEFTQGQSMKLVLLRKENPQGQIIGESNFSNIIRGPFQACFLGYRLDHRAVGQGLMQEALVAAIDYAFESLRLHRIMANYIPVNERSGRTLRRLGFTVEGYARDYLLIDGRWQDHILTALTNHKL
jgi:ribosomal-protein-alanine N-acetyltransferase